MRFPQLICMLLFLYPISISNTFFFYFYIPFTVAYCFIFPDIIEVKKENRMRNVNVKKSEIKIQARKKTSKKRPSDFDSIKIAESESAPKKNELCLLNNKAWEDFFFFYFLQHILFGIFFPSFSWCLLILDLIVNVEWDFSQCLPFFIEN